MRQPARLAAAIRHFHPTLRPRPQPTGLACGRAALAPGLLPRQPPPNHPKNGCIIFLCGSLLGLPQAKRVCPPALRDHHLTPCGRVTSRPAGASPHALRSHHLTPCGHIPSPPALAPGAVSASAHTQVTACFDYV